MPIINSIILYVKYYLLRRLSQHQPLPIQEATSKTELLSYKAPRDKGQATTSLESTLMYEASANMFWVNQFPASP